jgi:hypothetical protein
LRDARITDKKCPECNRGIEIFSIDTHVVCDCGFIAYNDEQSCLQWCAYASACVGEEIYEKYMKARADKDAAMQSKPINTEQ